MIIRDNYFVDVNKPIDVLAKEIMALPFNDASKAIHTLNSIDFYNDHETEYMADVCLYVCENMPEFKEKLDKILMGVMV